MQGLSKKCVDSLLNSGVDKAQAYSSVSERYEMSIISGDINLLRTTFDTDVSLKAIKSGRKSSISINKTDNAAIEEATKNANELLNTAEADEANDIAYNQPAKQFNSGDPDPDLNKMYERLKSFADTVKQKYPKIILEQAILDFVSSKSEFVNSNGVDYKMSEGIYDFVAEFTAKDGEKSSSINYTTYCTKKLDKELIDCGSVDILLKQASEQLDTKVLSGKFEGDIIITPDCLSEMLMYYTGAFLEDYALISGSSILKDKLNQKVASEKLTIHSKPVSEEITCGYFITPDGFEAKNSTIIDKGILKSFILSLYGANKTKRERSVNCGGAYVIEPGDKSFEDMVKSVNKGLLLCRFSGGQPSANGDFSGVAKNSYYIENGEIKYPVSETMITANLYKMFNDIKDISRERIDYGSALLPYIQMSNIVVSGK